MDPIIESAGELWISLKTQALVDQKEAEALARALANAWAKAGDKHPSEQLRLEREMLGVATKTVA
jgi:hypothetical protein